MFLQVFYQVIVAHVFTGFYQVIVAYVFMGFSSNHCCTCFHRFFVKSLLHMFSQVFHKVTIAHVFTRLSSSHCCTCFHGFLSSHLVYNIMSLLLVHFVIQHQAMIVVAQRMGTICSSWGVP